jgi:hypothetical protein
LGEGDNNQFFVINNQTCEISGKSNLTDAHTPHLLSSPTRGEETILILFILDKRGRVRVT